MTNLTLTDLELTSVLADLTALHATTEPRRAPRARDRKRSGNRDLVRKVFEQIGETSCSTERFIVVCAGIMASNPATRDNGQPYSSRALKALHFAVLYDHVHMSGDTLTWEDA